MIKTKEQEIVTAATRLTITNNNPPVEIDHVKIKNGNILVAREDLLPGGTKQRAIIPYLQKLQEKNFNYFVYASPFCGFAQVALAHAATLSNGKAIIFCEKNPADGSAHEFSKLAKKLGAKIYLCENLQEAEELSITYASLSANAYKIPLGFEDADYLKYMKAAIKLELSNIEMLKGKFPKRIWLPVGSGTLAKVFLEVIASECELLCVNVNIFNSNVERFIHLKNSKKITWLESSEAFCKKALLTPPIPSNIHYDAKLWKIINEEGRDGDLWWNVAK